MLTYGGVAFIIAGAAILIFPQLLEYGISTGVHVHNLDNLGIGFFLVIFAVVIIGFLGYSTSIKKAVKLGYTSKEPLQSSVNLEEPTVK